MGVDGNYSIGGGSPPRADGVTVLFVCTGNMCRSPVGEFILRSLALNGVAAESAGAEAVVGAKIDATMRRLLAKDGIDAASFQACQLTASQAERSDIILTATSEHRTTVLRDVPSALRRTFTVRELADLIELAEREGPLQSLDRRSHLTQLARLRGARSEDAADSIDDPYGLSEAHYIRAYLALSTAIRGPIARLLASITH